MDVAEQTTRIARRFAGRCKPIPGSNACVRRVDRDDNPGLARSMYCAAQCCGKNFPRFHFPASGEKPVIFNPLKIPLDVYVSPGFFTPVETPTEQSPVPLSCTSCVRDSPTALVVTHRAPRDGSRDRVARRAHHARAACRTRRHNHDGGEPRECYREAGFRIVKNRRFLPKAPGTDSRRSEKWLAITLALVLPALSRLDVSW
jgi:hypothetical protein